MTQQTISILAELFEEFGQNTYGEACSQIAHAISCAQFAALKQYSELLVISAFLHDIGHLIADREQLSGLTELGYPQHDELAANWLCAQGFPPTVTEPIRLHVAAKRYQARIGLQHLSPASLATLEEQGGLMDDEEAQSFEQHPYSNEALLLRQCDDAGKPDSTAEIDLKFWLNLVETFLVR
ncbi:HD domain-containing protein [Paraglaciecola hydrolytica]|uniref:HD domain-containing protein n=1 Tax=Paraglaciecola hydrolytica TaxID=1799789 RepID=A0A148KKU9_9ALTE|nr:hypothetical protein [Paraglaciecola hydrolytica]KXI26934.1 hypothetical protein AX660_02180 [Paraglaciecola hydrolytica]